MASSLILRRSIYPAAAAAAAISSCSRISEISVRRISSSSSSRTGPWLMLEDGVKSSYRFYSIADNQVISVDKQEKAKDGIVVGSSHGWLALMKRRPVTGGHAAAAAAGHDMFLYHPLSHRYLNLPPIETLPVSLEISPTEKRELIRPTKVILSSSPDQPEDDTCRAIMSFGPGDRLAYCRPGRSKYWTTVFDLKHEQAHTVNTEFKYDNDTSVRRVYEDFVYSNTRKELLCTTKFDNFESWDLHDDPLYTKRNWRILDDDMDYDADNYPWSSRSTREYRVKKDFCRSLKYLLFAERSNRLFLVRRNVMEQNDLYETIGFDVHEVIVDGDRYKMWYKKEELRYMDGTLDGMAFFIGSRGDGFVVEKGEMVKNNNVEPNSIYFTDAKELTPPPLDEDTVRTGHDIGIFNYENRTFSPCYYPRDADQRLVERINTSPMWFTPSPSSPSSSWTELFINKTWNKT